MRAICVLVVASCGPAHLEVPLAPGDMVVAGTAVGPQLTDAKVGRADERGVVSLELSGDLAEVVVFRWPSAALEDREGRPLAEDVLRGAEIGAAPDGCGRCADARATERQLIVAGDLCPAPSFAEVYQGGSLISRESAPQSPLVQWPGRCACAGTDLLTAPSLRETSRELIDSAELGEIYVDAAVDSDGNVALFGQDSILRIGSPSERLVPGYGQAPAAVAALGRGYLVAELVARERPESSQSLTFVDVVWLDELGRDVGRFETSLTTAASIEPLPALGLALVSGKRPKRGVLDKDAGSLLVCKVDPSLNCAELAPRSVETRLGARLLADGRVVSVGSDASVFVLERLPDPDEVVAVDDLAGVVRLRSGAGIRYVTTMADESRIGATARAFELFEDRAYFCAAHPGGSGPVVASRPIVGLEAGDTALAESLCGAADCLGLIRSGGGVEAILGVGLLGLDESGTATGCTPTAALIGAGRIIDGKTHAFGLTTMSDDSGRWFTRTGTGAVRRIHGPEAIDPIRAIAQADDELWAFASSSARVFRGSDEIRSVELSSRLSTRPRAAAWLGSDGEESTESRFLVALADGQLVRIDGRGEVSPAGTVPGSARMTRVRDGLALLATEVGRGSELYVVEEGTEPRFVDVEWDDPATAATETEPENCGFAPFRTLTAAEGRAWVGGCEGALFQLVVDAGAYRAERVSFAGFAADQIAQPDVTAVAALCADRVVVGFQDSGVAEARLFEVMGPSFSSDEIPRSDNPDGDFAEPIAISAVAGELRTVSSSFGRAFVDRRVADRQRSRLLLPSLVATGGVVFGESDAYVLVTQGRLVRVRF